ncbi:uncharacterized protein LOC136070629 [Quercus suber]|uniref:uncharacterized protein LOC136070629 n=1 Tax=Quercus suber TaxID=58331 RepID=UPI0032DF1A42
MWKPPLWPLIKVNFDGSIFRDEDFVGAGVLPYSPNAIEIIAATKALKFALNIGLSSIVLEGDSKITINALQSRGPSLVEFGNQIEEAKLLASQFTVVEFGHSRRQGNSIAHNIARHARHVSKFVMWMEELPPHLPTVILAESASFS